MGLIATDDDIDRFSSMLPFPVLLFPPTSYAKFGATSDRVDAADMDLCVRVVSLNMVHKSINVTVSVGVTSAALVSGTIAEKMSGGAAGRGGLRLGHPSGVTETFGKLGDSAAGPASEIAWVRLGRTARRIMQGEILVPPGKLRQLSELLAASAPVESG